MKNEFIEQQEKNKTFRWNKAQNRNPTLNSLITRMAEHQTFEFYCRLRKVLENRSLYSDRLSYGREYNGHLFRTAISIVLSDMSLWIECRVKS